VKHLDLGEEARASEDFIRVHWQTRQFSPFNLKQLNPPLRHKRTIVIQMPRQCQLNILQNSWISPSTRKSGRLIVFKSTRTDCKQLSRLGIEQISAEKREGENHSKSSKAF
jgi:hypothetical protein